MGHCCPTLSLPCLFHSFKIDVFATHIQHHILTQVINVVIIGAGFAGLAATHTLLKHVVPSLEAASGRQYKFTIVSPVSKFFHKVSAPRTLINPHLQGLDVGLVDIAPGLEQYGDKCVFLTGAVTTVDPSTKTVSYEGTEGAASGSARYDSLILASGADAREASYWSVTHGAKQLRAEFHELQSRIETAKTILIAGGGPVGVETAGEITNRFPARAKDVTIVSGGSRLLASIDNVAFGRHTERKLKRVGVEVLHNVRVSDSTRNAENGTTTVRLANGETRVVDLYIPCTGMRANSDFLPGSWVNGDGQASCDPQTFRVAGEKNVYAFGSIASYSDGTVFDVKNATKALAEAFRADQSEGVKATVDPKALYSKIQNRDMQFTPLGRNDGVCIVKGWRLPWFLCVFVKSRTFFVEQVPESTHGKGI